MFHHVYFLGGVKRERSPEWEEECLGMLIAIDCINFMTLRSCQFFDDLQWYRVFIILVHIIPPTGKCPSLDELYCFRDKDGKRIKIMNTVQAKWQELACALCMGSKVESIEKDTHSQTFSACRIMFTKWLDGGYREPVTWKTLLDVLKDSDCFDLAKTVRVALISKEA